MLNKLEIKRSHLHSSERDELSTLITNFKCLFPNEPNRASLVYYDLYRTNPQRTKIMR